MQAGNDYSKVCGWVDGNLEPIDKLYAHENGIRHKAVSVFIVRDDAVLLQQRAFGKYHTPGLWANSCCTHPLWNEGSQECAERRLREELGVTKLAPDYRHSLEYRADVGGGLIEHECVDVFVGKWNEEATLCPNTSEVAATSWMSIGDLVESVNKTPERYTPWLRIYMNEHRDQIFPSI